MSGASMAPPQQPQQLLLRRGPRPGLLKLALEASPLQQSQIPPCRIRSIALINGGDLDDRLLIYLGTDSGHLLLFTWFRSHGVPPVPDPAGTHPGVSESNKSSLLLTGKRNLGKSPVECLCPLPRAGRIAALLDQQVVVLDLHTMGPLEWLSSIKGAFTLTRALGSTESLQPVKGFLPTYPGTPGRQKLNHPDIPRKSEGQGQLGRLFGSGRLSGKRGGWSILTGEIGAASPSAGTSSGELGDARSSAPTTPIKKKPNSGSTVGALGPDAKYNGIERFAVAVKQKLLLYELHTEIQRRKEKTLAGDNNVAVVAVKVKEIPGPEEVVTMTWIGNVIITGNQQEYMLFSVTDGQASLLFSLPQDVLSPPLMKPFPKELEVLLLMDNVGVGVNAAGQPTSSSLFFKDVPDAIGQSSSYVVIVKQGLVELFHRKTGAKVQSVVLSDTAMGPYLISDDDDGKFLVVSNALKVYCLERVPVDEQLKELLRQRQIDEAVELAEECVAEVEDDNAKERLATVHAQAGFLLFFDLQFKDAVDQFLESSVMHPAEIFPFFPNLTDRWRAMVPRNRYWGLHPPPQAIQNVIEIKLQAIHRGLILQSISNMNDLPNGHNLLASSTRSKSTVMEEYTLQATEQVIRYLKVARNKPMTVSMKEGVDTLLMKLLIKLGVTGEMEKLAAHENSCLVEEVEDLLQDSGNLRTLAFLYETKDMQALALQVWQTLAHGSMNMPRLEAAPAREVEGILLPESVGKPVFQIAAASEASRLLEASSDSDLVLTHIAWILNVSRDLALQILCSPKRVRALPPDDVLRAFGPSEAYVQQRYLQWLVREQGVKDPRYHTLFALSLAKSAIRMMESDVLESQGSKEAVLVLASATNSHMMDELKMETTTKKSVRNGYPLGTELKDSTCMQPQSDTQGVISNSAGNSNDPCILSVDIRYRLQEFLESSEMYDPSTVLALVRGSELWREQAILHRKLGDEISVFQILALKLGDTDAAERYCTELGRPDAFMRLLDMYLQPGEGREPMYSAAVHLLQLHGTSLDPLQVLEALSPDMPLQLAFETIARMFRTRVHLHREGQIIRHLTRTENFEARIARLEERARCTRITDQSSCGSCFARFGTKLFALYPNGSVVCYKCFRSSGSHIDPVTGRDFQKDPTCNSKHNPERKMT